MPGPPAAQTPRRPSVRGQRAPGARGQGGPAAGTREAAAAARGTKGAAGPGRAPRGETARAEAAPPHNGRGSAGGRGCWEGRTATPPAPAPAQARPGPARTWWFSFPPAAAAGPPGPLVMFTYRERESGLRSVHILRASHTDARLRLRLSQPASRLIGDRAAAALTAGAGARSERHRRLRPPPPGPEPSRPTRPSSPCRAEAGVGRGGRRGLPASPFLSARGTPPPAARVSTRSTYGRGARARRAALPPPNERRGSAGGRGRARARSRAAGLPAGERNLGLPGPPRGGRGTVLPRPAVASGPLITTPAGLPPGLPGRADWPGAPEGQATPFVRPDTQTESSPETAAASSPLLLAQLRGSLFTFRAQEPDPTPRAANRQESGGTPPQPVPQARPGYWFLTTISENSAFVGSYCSWGLCKLWCIDDPVPRMKTSNGSPWLLVSWNWQAEVGHNTQSKLSSGSSIYPDVSLIIYSSGRPSDVSKLKGYTVFLCLKLFLLLPKLQLRSNISWFSNINT